MAKNRRISVNLSPESYEVIRDVSEASGVSMSAYIDQMVLSAAPSIRKVAKALHQANERNLDTYDTLLEAIHSAMGDASQAALGLDEQKRLQRRKPSK